MFCLGLKGKKAALIIFILIYSTYAAVLQMSVFVRAKGHIRREMDYGSPVFYSVYMYYRFVDHMTAKSGMYETK